MKQDEILKQYVNTLVDLTKEIERTIQECTQVKINHGYMTGGKKIISLKKIAKQIDSVIDLIYQRKEYCESDFDMHISNLIGHCLQEKNDKQRSKTCKEK